MDITGASALWGRLQQSPHERELQSVLGQRSQRPVRPQPIFGEGTREWKNEQMNWGSTRYCVEYLANSTAEYLANSIMEYQTDSPVEYNCKGHT